MRIAQVSPFLPSRAGGSVVYSTNLALQLQSRGHYVEFFAARTSAEDGGSLKERHVAVHTRPTFGIAFGVNPMAYLLSDLLRSDAEIIHAHSYIYATSNQAAIAARVRSRPFVLHMHGATYQGQGIADRRISGALFLKEKVYDKTLGRWTIGSADAIAAVSAFDMQQCRETFDVSPDRIPDLLRRSSVLLLPSFIEGLPTSCLEALAAGTAVVASDTGGTSEIIHDGLTGFLCPRGDLDAFADRVVRLLRDPVLRSRFGQNGRALVEHQYSWTRVAEMTERLYERLV